jgi:hypothetical protein
MKIPTDLKNNANVKLTWNSTDTADESVQKDVKFGAPDDEIDESVKVSDNKGGTTFIALGDATKADKTFPYANDVPACVPPGGERTNTAKLVTNDTQTEKTATHKVLWNCEPQYDGCTLTQGYWKTHSEFGPAPWNEVQWSKVTGQAAGSCGGTVGPPSQRADMAPGSGADVVFNDGFGDYVGKVCYFDVYWDPDNKKGNYWYHLAHQYIAAEMNILADADPSAIADVLPKAKALLEKYGTSMMIDNKNPDRGDAIMYADILEQYNSGDIGPGHCDDDGAR